MTRRRANTTITKGVRRHQSVRELHMTALGTTGEVATGGKSDPLAAGAPGRPDSTTILSLQIWRAVAALLVLLYHLATILKHRVPVEVEARDFLRPFEWTGLAGVDLFFVVSGVVMTTTCYSQLGQAHEVIPFLKRRIARIYPLYWIVTFGVLALCWTAPSLAARSKTDVAEIMQSFMLWPQTDYPIVGVGWTLTYEMFFYLTFAVLLAFPRRYFVALLAAWAITTMALFPLFSEPAPRGILGNLSLPLYASPLVLEFIAGCFIALGYRHGRMPGAKPTLVVGLLWLFAIGGYFGSHYFDEAAYGAVRLGVFGIPAVLLIYGTLSLERNGARPTSPLFLKLGDASYSLYLTHVYVILLLVGLYTRVEFAKGEFSRLGLVFASLIACCAVGLASFRWVEAPLTRTARSWISGDGRTASGVTGTAIGDAMAHIQAHPTSIPGEQ